MDLKGVVTIKGDLFKRTHISFLSCHLLKCYGKFLLHGRVMLFIRAV